MPRSVQGGLAAASPAVLPGLPLTASCAPRGASKACMSVSPMQTSSGHLAHGGWSWLGPVCVAPQIPAQDAAGAPSSHQAPEATGWGGAPAMPTTPSRWQQCPRKRTGHRVGEATAPSVRRVWCSRGPDASANPGRSSRQQAPGRRILRAMTTQECISGQPWPRFRTRPTPSLDLRLSLCSPQAWPAPWPRWGGPGPQGLQPPVDSTGGTGNSQ